MFDQVKSIVNSHMNNSSLSDSDKINQSLRILAKVRSNQIATTIKNEYGLEVLGGPFKGMNFIEEVSEGCYVPKLLGIYESELHPLIKLIINDPPDIFINVGSAEGYYSVGLKRLLPKTEVYAFDIDINAQNKTNDLAKINNVDIFVNGEFNIEILKDFKRENIFLMCDIEGDEVNLFKKDKIQFLKNISICIELHIKDGIHNKNILPELFKDTHDVEIVWQKGKENYDVPDAIKNLEHLDLLLSAWEWRSYPTPWLIATPIN